MKYGAQDPIGLGQGREERCHGIAFPARFKSGVSGCLRCCGESSTRDVGLVATTKGWTVVFGETAGDLPWDR